MAYDGKRVRLTDVQRRHIAFFHPKVLVNEKMLMDTLDMPDIVTKGGRHKMQVLYKYYESTPVTSKYLAVVIKVLNQEGFIVTSYFTDRTRGTKVLWKRTG